MDFVRGDHHPTGGHFAPHQLGLDLLAAGDEFHLRRDDTRTGQLKLRNRFRHNRQIPSMSKNVSIYPIAMGQVVNERPSARGTPLPPPAWQATINRLRPLPAAGRPCRHE